MQATIALAALPYVIIAAGWASGKYSSRVNDLYIVIVPDKFILSILSLRGLFLLVATRCTIL